MQNAGLNELKWNFGRFYNFGQMWINRAENPIHVNLLHCYLLTINVMPILELLSVWIFLVAWHYSWESGHDPLHYRNFGRNCIWYEIIVYAYIIQSKAIMSCYHSWEWEWIPCDLGQPLNKVKRNRSVGWWIGFFYYFCSSYLVH